MERNLIAFVWLEPDGVLVVAAYLSVVPVEDILDRIDELVGSIELE